MKKIWVLGIFLFWAWVSGDVLVASDYPEPSVEKTRMDTMHPMREVELNNRVRDLERRFYQLDQELRYLKDQVRNLDREVDDLRQRHV